jgi:hypothetical protein
VLNSTFFGKFTALTRGGEDEVLLEIGVAAPVTTFGGPVKIKTGGGDDSVQLGVTGIANAEAVFRSQAIFNGGGGMDTFDDQNSDTDAVIIDVNFEVFP